MSVGLLLVTHEGIARPLLAVAERMLRRMPLRAGSYELPFDLDLETALPLASAELRKVDDGDGVLVLTDVYGASPSNLAAQLVRLGTPAKRVSGVSLPMVLRVMNYADHDLAGLQSIASVGGRNGVVLDEG
ncbi:PTS sugar transporter subunit IIA [Solilutibacter silvestris]|uniref:Phosphotransferase system mannose/fructose-specific component IIA n=1 Tax=Solilutibacter silvestris TaxID=1645665 RepID=A0A2K1Q2U4_9GAMM|nr:PTS fructose IIA subunit family protein [Lysobacter silvestris]PNS09368.1 Phosphotransferase system mannose/fructose-specific component IIA [Lysobacter silvestris]